MSYKLEIEFSGQDGSQFRDAWIGWDELVWFNTIRFGNQKRPYGLDHLNSSNFNLFLERPFIVDAFNEDNRRFGLVSYGVSDDLRFNWRYGLYDLSLIQDIGSTLNDNYPLEFAWRMANTFWYDEASDGRGYGHLGLSGTFAFPDPDPAAGGASESRARFRTRPEGRSNNRWLDTGFVDGANAYQLLGVESVVNVGRFQFAGEYMNVWMQRLEGYGSDLRFHGGYFYLSYFLTGEHIPWNRDLGILGRVSPFEAFFHVNTCDGTIEHGIGAWEVAARFSHADLTDENIYGGVGDSITLALNWYWNAHARLSLNYIYGHIDDRLATLSGGGSQLVAGSYEIFGLRSIIDF
jgi:phosphate-selective porin OprO/OprP